MTERRDTPPDTAHDTAAPASDPDPDDALQQRIADEATGGRAGRVEGTEAPPAGGGSGQSA